VNMEEVRIENKIPKDAAQCGGRTVRIRVNASVSPLDEKVERVLASHFTSQVCIPFGAPEMLLFNEIIINGKFYSSNDPWQNIDIEKAHAEAEKLFTNHCYKDEILLEIDGHLKELKTCGKVTFNKSGRMVFLKEEDRIKAESIDSAVSSFFRDNRLFMYIPFSCFDSLES